MPKIISHLWFPENAREAVDFYVSTIPNSAISGSTTVPAETPSGPPGSVTVIEFRLGDQNFTALEAGFSILSTTLTQSRTPATTRKSSTASGRPSSTMAAQRSTAAG